MIFNTDTWHDAQPFRDVLRRVIVDAINQAETPMDREERIQIALEERAIDAQTAYDLRCGA